MRKWIIILAVVSVGVGGFFGYRQLHAAGEELPYRTESLSRGNVVSTATATGTLEPLLKVLVGSQVSGTVVAWYADFNQTVKAGEVLAELDQDRILAEIDQQEAQLATARARAEEAAARVADAMLELKRLEFAHSRSGAASDFELDRARTAHQATVAARHAAEAQIQVAEATLRAARIQHDKTIIRSPIDGMVISRDVDAGQTVAASLSAPTLFTIANDLSQMRVNAAVSETDIGHIREGMSAQFRVDAYPERRFSGVVTQVRFAETVVDNVVTYQTLIDVQNPEMLLRPGMTATILFELQRAEDTLLIPNAALRFDPRRQPDVVNWRPGRGRPMQPRVYKLAGEELVEIEVDLGISDGSFTQLITGDLQGSDVVVVGWKLSGQRSGRRRTRLF